jgi:aspartyl aminopeptidase
MLKSEDVFMPKKAFVNFKDTTICIPNLAIHRNRDVNKGIELNPQIDMIPMIGQIYSDDKEYFTSYLAEQLEVEKQEILDYDINVYVNEPGQLVGLNNEFIKAPRIDNLSMAYSSIKALIESESDIGINLVTCFDNEEIGSTSKQGANSGLLEMVLERIFKAYDKTKEQYLRVLPNSYFISADGAYAIHPNKPDKNDPTNQCIMNEGLAIKMNANRSYYTDAETAAIFQQLCNEIDLPVQRYVNRSDMLGGRTIGSMMESHIGIKGVDMGAPMLAMHSAMEYMGTDDLLDSNEIFKHFFRK